MTIMTNPARRVSIAAAAARLVLPAAALLLFAVLTAQAEERPASIAGLAVAVWSPDASRPTAPPASAKLPLVIFSHGFHGCATQSRFLMQALAGDGYLIVAPNHRDAACDGGASRFLDPPQAPLLHPEEWSGDTYRDRATDIRRLVAALRADPQWTNRIDWRRGVALAGHSLGGYTVLGLAGAWPNWRLQPGVSAVLALSPYAQPFVVRHDLSGLSAPVMYQGGTLDFGITPAVARPDGAYARSPAPKYFVEFQGAGHLAWADFGRSTLHEPITTYALAFLDHYVKGAPADPILTHAAGPAVARLSYDLGPQASR